MSALHREALSFANKTLWAETGLAIPATALEKAIQAYSARVIVDRPVSAVVPASKKMALTAKQKELLDFITRYTSEQGGVSPSFDEMKDYLGLASKSGIHRLICGLEERCLILRIANRARTIVVV